MEYSPAGFVFVAVGTPVATLVAVTAARATMAPEESVTMPRMAPVTVCPKAGQWGMRRTSAHANDLEISFMILPPLSGIALLCLIRHSRLKDRVAGKSDLSAVSRVFQDRLSNRPL